MVNYIFSVLLLVFLSINGTDSLLLLENEKTARIIKEYENKVVFNKVLDQMEQLCPILIEVLHQFLLNTHYWKKQQLMPFSYFLSKDPSKWIYRKKEWRKIDEYLQYLQQEQEHNAYYLALFKHYIQTATYSPELADAMIDALESCLFRYTVISNKTAQSGVVEERLKRIELWIKNYKKNALYSCAHCSKPNHFQRNWIAYFLLVTSSLGMGYFIHQNKNNLKNWSDMAFDAVKKYYDEHISAPIVKSLKALLRRDRDPVITKKGVQSCGNLLELQVRSYIETNNLPYSSEEIEGIIKEVKTGNIEFIMNELNDIVQAIDKKQSDVEELKIELDSYVKDDSYGASALRWITGDKKSIERFNVAIARLEIITKKASEIAELFPQVKKMGVLCYMLFQASLLMGSKIALEGETQFNANKFNFEIAAILPSALVLYGTYSLAKKLFVHIMLQKNTYEPLRKALRNLDIIYNKYLSDVSAVSLIDQGYCHYWLEQFKKHTSQMNIDEQIMILEDIAHLEDASMSVTQKLHTIQRMYFNYNFLLPSS